MAVRIVIDGYNLIKQSHELSRLDHLDIEKGRHGLLNKLAAYKKIKRHRITVVFDGCKGGGFTQERTKEKGIDIVFSKQGEEADDVIKRIVAIERENVLVVTSDREIAEFSEKRGAAVVPSGEFEMKMELAVFSEDKGEDETLYDESLDRPIHTKKKGPSKRLSRSKRRYNTKIRKL